MSSASSPDSTMTPESDTGSFAPTSPAFEAHDYMYRSMVRQLLLRYTKQELDQLLEEESNEAAACRSALLAATHSGDYAALVPDDVAHGMMCYTANFGALDDMSPRSLPRSIPRSIPNPSAASGSLRPLASAGSPTPGTGAGTRTGGRPSSGRMDYACGFCAEICIPKTFTRRNDLRRHIDQFHNTNAQWRCQHPGCHRAFDWSTAYQIHLREDHGGSLMRVSEAKVVLCPQTVFACGYEGCPRVFEAADDGDVPATWKLYTTHLIKHCDEGRDAGPWEYSHRMRNLLSQSRLSAAWGAVSDSSDSSQLQWEPASSRTLRKLLETRHVADLPRLVGCAMMLGSARATRDSLEAEFDLRLPIKRECPRAASKHDMGDDSPPADLALGGVPYGMPSANSAAYQDPSGPVDSYTLYNDSQTLPTPVASPHAPFCLPGPALYEDEAAQPQYAAAHDAVAVTHDHADPWTAVYAYTKLDLGDPMALEE
ncbi:Uncharacterized protein TPAR_00848 [Tolypocladium paradoxum]|uniref:C2H2-type domain-containing protein n=1 Tax=Tolypocladium paradoxum TaxID=94208 RepID=A0A2S4L930_9HYPO|nr:Uncharacterized protein TPAR_00848 [Tolypocladium paradoxum]